MEKFGRLSQRSDERNKKPDLARINLCYEQRYQDSWATSIVQVFFGGVLNYK